MELANSYLEEGFLQTKRKKMEEFRKKRPDL